MFWRRGPLFGVLPTFTKQIGPAEWITFAKPNPPMKTLRNPEHAADWESGNTVVSTAPAAGHTPLPWKVWKLSPDSDPKERFIIVTEDGEREVTGIIDRIEDAELIVRAVNERETLLDLLTRALPYVEEGEEFNKPNTPKLSALIRKAILL